MTLQVVRFGGTIEPVKDPAKAFGEVNIDGPNLTDADNERLKAIVLMCVSTAYCTGAYTAASVSADPSKLIASIEGQLELNLLGDNATGKVVSITVVGGAEPAEPTESVALAGEVLTGDGRKAKLFGSALVGGVSDLDKAKQVIAESAAMMAGMGMTVTSDDGYRGVAEMARLGLRDAGFPTANVKVMFLQVV